MVDINQLMESKADHIFPALVCNLNKTVTMHKSVTLCNADFDLKISTEGLIPKKRVREYSLYCFQRRKYDLVII